MKPLLGVLIGGVAGSNATTAADSATKLNIVFLMTVQQLTNANVRFKSPLGCSWRRRLRQALSPSFVSTLRRMQGIGCD